MALSAMTTEQKKKRKTLTAAVKAKKSPVAKPATEIVSLERAAKRSQNNRERDQGIMRLLTIRGSENVSAETRDAVAGIPGRAVGLPEAQKARKTFRFESGQPDITSPSFLASQLERTSNLDPNNAVRAARIRAGIESQPPRQDPSFNPEILNQQIAQQEQQQSGTATRLAMVQRDMDKAESVAKRGLTPEQGAELDEARKNRTTEEKRIILEAAVKESIARSGVESSRVEGQGAASETAKANASEGRLNRDFTASENDKVRQFESAQIDKRFKQDQELMNGERNPDVLTVNGAPVIDPETGKEVLKPGSETELRNKRAESVAQRASAIFDSISGKGLINLRGGYDASDGLNVFADDLESVPFEDRQLIQSHLIRELTRKRSDFGSGDQGTRYFNTLLQAIEQFNIQAIRDLSLDIKGVRDRDIFSR